MKEYDYIIVGAGLYGSVLAYELTRRGKNILVLEKSSHIGGTCYTKTIEGINVHCYGAHIFRTDDDKVFAYISQFASFNNFVNSPIGISGGKAYNLPFNMNTFAQIFGTVTPQDARMAIDEDRAPFYCESPKNLEEWALCTVGPKIYETLIRGYTEKQWGRKCIDLPPETMKRIPLRFSYDNNYYNSRYQGVPIGGYTPIFEKFLARSKVLLNTDFNANREKYLSLSDQVIYTGPIDELLDFKFGLLEYRGLRFITKVLGTTNFQGNAVFNYCDTSVPYTRTIEHKFFEKQESEKTVITYEYPAFWKLGDYPFYPINDPKNNDLYSRYRNECLRIYGNKIKVGGRLGAYSYFDMQDTIKAALNLNEELSNDK